MICRKLEYLDIPPCDIDHCFHGFVPLTFQYKFSDGTLCLYLTTYHYFLKEMTLSMVRRWNLLIML